MERDLTDSEILALPEWRGALEDLVADYRLDHNSEPSLSQTYTLIEVLINRFRKHGFLMPQWIQ